MRTYNLKVFTYVCKVVIIMYWTPMTYLLTMLYCPKSQPPIF